MRKADRALFERVLSLVDKEREEHRIEIRALLAREAPMPAFPLSYYQPSPVASKHDGERFIEDEDGLETGYYVSEMPALFETTEEEFIG